MDDEAKRNLQIIEQEFLNSLNDLRRLRGLHPLDGPLDTPFCSLCGEGKNLVSSVVDGVTAFFCERCLPQAQQLLGRPLK